MLVDCMFFQPYQSLIESQNDCLDNSNLNSETESTLNQFESPVRADISTRPFSFSFISVANFLIALLYFSSIDIFICFEFLQIIFDYIVCCKSWCDFAGVHNFHCLIKFWNSQWSTILDGREISTNPLSLHTRHPVTAGINFFQIVLSRGKWVSGGCLEWFSGYS